MIKRITKKEKSNVNKSLNQLNIIFLFALILQFLITIYSNLNFIICKEIWVIVFSIFLFSASSTIYKSNDSINWFVEVYFKLHHNQKNHSLTLSPH